ncbi:MAG: class I SAM-dependent methyltransferase [Rickettsiales bacterium]
MKDNETLSHLTDSLLDAVATGALVKLTLRKPTATAGDLKSIDIRPIMVKRELKLSFTYHHQTRDVVKNHPPHEAASLITAQLLEHFRAAHLCTTGGDTQLTYRQGGYQHSHKAPSITAAPELSHDRAKQRFIDSANKPYLHALGIADAKGAVYKNAQDKFRQINKYIEVLDGLIRSLPKRDTLRIVDMGAGKGYLTFALYDYVTNTINHNVEVVGVEFRPDLVTECNNIARASGFKGLQFVEGSIAGYDCEGADAVIALHACDTATDDAIAKAIHAQASLIVVAPCCHKQIRRAMGKHRPDHPIAASLQYGTYVERISEMLTDTLRAQLMEMSGYKANLFEFISDAHTPKNVMIVASKLPALPKAKELDELRNSIARTKNWFCISEHYLERLL